ncbi:MAG: glutathione binding-like protein, partial [Myxococcota bacterium]|nr:glutathione binding-like protein [Myxococcota bacterium]
YGIERYTNEANRLYGVLDRRLEGRTWIADDYSIADIACWPWIVPHERQGQSLDEFPHVKAWFERMQARPAVERGFAVGRELRDANKGMDEEAKKILFGQRARR